MIKKRMLSCLVAILLLFSIGFVGVRAAEPEMVPNSSNFNIIVVLDGSGSLINGYRSDEHGYRYDATSMFLDLLPESGSNVGAVVFHGKNEVTEIEMTTLNSQKDKDTLKKKIEKVPTGGYSDIGTALLTAAERLKGMSEANGNKSIIVLFTDGATQTTDVQSYDQSVKNREKAEQLINAEDIILCGVFLNNDNRVTESADPEDPNTEVLDIVRKANGYSDDVTENQMAGRYFPISSAADLMKAYQHFYTLINPTPPQQFPKDVSFLIPGIGVTDVNISIIAHPNENSTIEDSKKTIDQTKVTITRPSGTVMPDNELSDIMSRGKTYAVYKINNPEAGQWHVHVDTPENDVTVECNLIINVDIGAGLETSVDDGVYRANQPFAVSANLYDGGTKITERSAYQEYTCHLKLVNTVTMEETTYPLTLDQNGSFSTECTLPDYKAYYANVVFTCGNAVNISSDTFTWSVQNSKPESPESYTLTASYGLFSSNEGSDLDLSSLVHDLEDPLEKITYKLNPGSYNRDAIQVVDGLLCLDEKLGGSGEMSVTYTDTQGDSTTTRIIIVVTDNTVRDICILIALVVLLAVAVVTIVYIFLKNKRLDDGVITLTVPLVSENNNDVTISIELDGAECQNKALHKILSDHQETLVREATFNYEFRVEESAQKAVQDFLRLNKSLSSVTIGAGPKFSNGTDDDGIKHFARKCRVRAKKDLLVNEKSPCDLSNGGSVEIQVESSDIALVLHYEIR